MSIKIIKSRCIVCGVCIVKCPEHAISIVDSKASIDMEKCSCCKKCIGKCLANAIVETH